MPTSPQSWKTLFEQALLAQASYANLVGVAIENDEELIQRLSTAPVGEDPVMGRPLAEYLAGRFGVVDHVPNMQSGYSATLFRRLSVDPEDASLGYVFALRGTDWGDDDGEGIDWFLGDVRQIALGGDAIAQRLDMHQHWNWLVSMLPELSNASINVTGHSLGGHLATWFAIDKQPFQGHAFTFNGAGLAYIKKDLVPVNRISNVISDPYWDMIQKTGQQFGFANRIYVETQIDGEWGAVGHNNENLLHGVASRYLLSLIDSDLTDAVVMKLMAAVSNDRDGSYEALASILRTTFGVAIPPTVTEKNGDFTFIELISNFESSAPGPAELTSLVGLTNSQLKSLASTSDNEGAAIRFAMVHALPFAVVGAGAEASLDPTYGVMNFSSDYLSERASYLGVLWERNVNKLSWAPSLSGDFVYRSFDNGVETIIGAGPNPDPEDGRQIVFGENANQSLEVLTGGDFSDRLFGGGGSDQLMGGGGNDFLDGGAADDILVGGTGSDIANGGAGRDLYMYLEGDEHLTIRGDDGLGSGGSTDIISINLSEDDFVLGDSALTRPSAGSNVYFDGHDNQYILNGTSLSVVIEDGGTIEIEDFASGDFGISLPTNPPPYEPPPSPATFLVQPSEIRDPSTDPSYGQYTGNGWWSPAGWYDTLANEIIYASEAVPTEAWQTIYARVKGGFGDSDMFGDAGFNWLVDDLSMKTSSPYLGAYHLDVNVGNDYLDGGAGNDWLATHGGDDEVHGGLGDDVIVDSHAVWDRSYIAQGGTWVLWSYSSTDWVNQPGNSSNDWLFGDGGNDYIAAHGGDQKIDGGLDHDELFGGAGNDVLVGDEGNDVLSGDTRLSDSPFVHTGPIEGHNYVFDGNLLTGDTLYYGTDTLDGGNGNDTLFGGGGGDILRGGAGDDRIQGDFLNAAIYTDLRTGLQAHGSDPLSIQGDDRIWGDAGNDEIHGGGGHDTIFGGADNDTIYAGTGDDFVDGGTGIDYIVGDNTTGDQGVDDLRGGDGDDTVFGMGGTDFLYGDAGIDTLVGGTGDDWLEGNDGDDVLFGEADNDVLLGGAGSDQLQGGDGDDTLDAGDSGSGNQLLFGQAGNDTFVLSAGAGHVQITDTEGVNRLVFGAGISQQDVRVSRSGGFVYVDFTDTDYAFMTETTFATLTGITLDDSTTLTADELRHQFEPGTVSNGTLELGAGVAASEVSFHGRNSDLILAYDGSVTDWVDTSTLASRNVAFETGDGAAYGLAAGTKVLVLTNWYLAIPASYIREIHEAGQPAVNFVFTAYELTRTFTAGDESSFVSGTTGNDALIGSAEGDILNGDLGNDELVGGEGADLLTGGAGDDSYRFNLGDGEDLIFDDAGTDDVIRFGPGITAASLTVTETDGGLHVQVGSPVNGDSIMIANWSQGSALSIDRFVFDDASSLTRAQIDALNTGNHSPRVETALSDQAARVGMAMTYTVPADTFGDPGDTLTYSAWLADGSPLPSWLVFNPTTRQFAGVPPGGSAGILGVQVRVVDSGGLINTVNFNLEVTEFTASMGTTGDDYLSAVGPGAFDLYGLSGDDNLTGGAEDDRLYGGHGADTLDGAAGNDTYYYRRGDGHDTIDHANGLAGDVERLVFDASISVSDVVFTSTYDGDLIISFRNPGGAISDNDSIFIVGALQPGDPKRALDEIVFESDGTVLTPSQIAIIPTDDSDYIRGTSGDDTIDAGLGYDFLFGEGGNDTLIGGEEDDTLDGGAGSDTYIVGRNEGFDTIANSPDADPASIDVLKFAAGIAPADVRVLPNGGNDFELQVLGAGGEVQTTVNILGARNEATGYQILDEVRFTGDSTIWSLADLRAFSLAPTNGSDAISGFSTGDTILGAGGNDWLLGNGGNDTLQGGADNDQLDGGAGDDTYRFGYNQAYDEINDTSGTNQLQLDTGVLPANVTLYRVSSRGTLLQSQDVTTNDDLMVVLDGSNQQILIEGYFNGANPRPINQIVFGDGSIWNNAAIDANTVNQAGTGNSMSGTSGNDNFTVDHYADTISESSGGGTDSVSSSVTYTLPTNVENLTLTGSLNLGAIGNSGSNTLIGNSGANFMDGGGSGTDVLQGGSGDDTYRLYNSSSVTVVESAGGGYDTILVNRPSITMPNDVERMIAVADGSAWQESNVNVFGNALDNVIDVRTPNTTGVIGYHIDGREGADVMYGPTSGFTTFVVDNAGDVVMNADEGDTIRSSVSYSLVNGGGTLELEGAGNLTGTGNAQDNTLDAMWNTGASTLIGGLGDDHYNISSNDIVIENADSGLDSVELSGSGWGTTIDMSSFANVEDLEYDGGSTGTTYTIHGTSAANSIIGAFGTNVLHGYDGDDVLRGRDGDDTLYGGAGNDDLSGGAGSDTMVGGTGDDTYDVITAGDVVVELMGEGIDSVYSQLTYTLAAALENLRVGGDSDGTGNAADNLLEGSSGTNTLSGLAGNDTLDSQGGGDTLIGGIGNDDYRIWSSTDVIVENAGEGHDVVYVEDGDYTMGANVEDMVISGAADSNVTGNAQANVITGNEFDNRIDGGAGNDTLIGDLGDDTYVIDGIGDTIVEASDSGTDTVETHLQWTLSSEIENLTLTGAAAVNGTGSARDNVLTGNSGANSLYGLEGNDILYGGGGADILTGGSGNDVYLIEDASDTIVELADEGTDLVRASVNYTLGAHLENVALLSGSGNINATGNALDNDLIGNEGNNRLEGGVGADRLIGGSGDDTYVVDALDSIIESSGYDTVESAITWTLGLGTERLVLTGSDAINGTGHSSQIDTLIGNSAANRLDGAGGGDTMQGGAGDDVYVVDINTDVIIEQAGEGTDLVEAHYSTTLSANVENLTLMTNANALSATGNSMENVLLGNNLGNTLTGMAGNDTLNGGLGIDALIGGLGDDTYIVDTNSDTITENSGEGTDTILTTVGLTVAANVENATLTGTGASDLTGNALNNVLTGNAAINTLNGGTGDDSLVGGAGNDIYVLDSAGDAMVEAAGEGTDLVQASATVTLAANVENLTLTGTSGIGGTGNSLDNILTGNSGNNTLSGADGNDTIDGGTGNDTMIGGTGNDNYVVNVATDVITENAGEGTDTVSSSVALTLAANVENLTLTGSSGLAGTGNALDNVLIGNSGANTLTGLGGNDTLNGGSGNDTMVGGTGDDIYVVGATGDVVTENASEGVDTIQSSVTYTASANVENLILTGSSNVNATGNALDNSLTGNSGNNTMSGSTGNDTMAGGAGNDTYVVDSTADVVVELAGEGTDLVQAGATYSLSAEVENLTLTGTSVINGTGNALNNVLTGNTVNNTLTGGDGNDTIDGGTGNDTMVGGAGDDNYAVNVATDVITESAGEGIDSVSSSVTLTLAANVENLTLTGSSGNSATGNALNNVLTGNSGANTLDGLAGADTLIGGSGNDTYVVDSAADVVTELAGQGSDTIQASVSLTLGAEVEYLTLTGSALSGTGNTLNNTLIGNASNNTLTGLAGNDTLDGGTGTDTMLGGTENDTYVVDAAGDIVTELAGEGTDTVQTGLTYTLGAEVENLTLTGAGIVNGTGNSLNNVLTGNTANNTLTGLAGNDTIDGGTGNDTMIGGIGDDTYVVNVATDVVTENAGEGTDTVQSAVTLTLGNNVENLTLTGSSGNSATGNALDNVLTGNSGANTLSGLAGADTMIGGSGNDTYVVADVGDIVTELAGQGTDTVQTALNYTLGAEIENLTLTGSSGLTGTGNALNNALTGNSGANTLTGLAGNDTLSGGTGSDTMIGGLGDDTYVVDVAGDVVTELVGEGTDTVQASLTYTLGADVENLTLTGSSAINGTGNSLNNVLTGNSGANTLTGGGGNDTIDGGTGNDTMIGGAGDDSYVVNVAGDVVTEAASEGIDSITSAVALTLGANVENLTFSGSSGLAGTGNTLDNVLTGNSGANTLTGLAGNDTLNGGTGNDTMVGGTGDDIYFVNVATDVVTENASEGTDTVNSSATLTLVNNVENLTLTGSSAINGTGQALNNVLTGNTGVNTLSGLAGNDTLEGKAGNDALTGGDGADFYRYSAGDGSDTINNVAADSAIDRLVFTNVTRLQLSFARVGDDLVITRIAAPTDTVRVTGWFTATGNRLDFVDTSDGHATTANEIDALIGGGGGSFPDGMSSPAIAMMERRRTLWSLDELMVAASKPGRRHGTGGIERRFWSAAALNGVAAVNPILRSQPSDLVEPRQITSSLDSMMTAASKFGHRLGHEGIQPRLWPVASTETLAPPSPAPAPASVPVAMAETRQPISGLEVEIAAAPNAGQSLGPAGIEPRLWTSESPAPAEVIQVPDSMPVAFAESRLATSSLDAMMDLAGSKSRPVLPVCPVDDRFRATDESSSGAATPALRTADAENPIRCELQLDRLIQAMASFKKPDGFDSLQQLPVGDGLAQGTLAISQGRYASVSTHVEHQL